MSVSDLTLSIFNQMRNENGIFEDFAFDAPKFTHKCLHIVLVDGRMRLVCQRIM